MRATALLTIGMMLAPALAAASVSTPAQSAQVASAASGDVYGMSSNSSGWPVTEPVCEDKLLTSWENTMPALGFGSPAATAAIDAAVKKLLNHSWLNHSQFPGGRWPAFSLAISNGSKLVFARTYGYADYSTMQPAHPDSLFRLASDSKQITGATILKLIANGQSVDGNPEHKLTLDSKVFQILTSGPNAIVPKNGPGTLDPSLKNITVEQVLHHTGGWMPGIGDPVWYAQQPGAVLPPTEQAVVSYMMNQPVHFTPGTTFSYSNFGYNLLATLITKITGKDYEQVVKEQVLNPLGATHAQVGHSLPGQRVDGEVHHYSFVGIPPQPSVFPSVPSPIVGEDKIPYGQWSLEAGRGAGGWLASPMDMLKFQLGINGRGTTQVYPNIVADIMANHNQPSQVLCTDTVCPNPTKPIDPAKDRYNAGWGVHYWGWGGPFEDFELDHGGGTADTGSYNESIPGTPFFNWMTPQAFLYGMAFTMNTATPPTLPNNDVFDPADDLRAVMFDQIKAHQSLLDPSWPADTDFTDQYGDFSPWMDAATFAQTLNTALHTGCTYKGKAYHGCYPSRLEGKAPALCYKNGTCPTYYRAQFVPLHQGWDAQVIHGASCSQYVAKSSETKANGYQQINLQWYRDQNGRMNVQSVWVKM